jgi:hypothetical protein
MIITATKIPNTDSMARFFMIKKALEILPMKEMA